MLKRWAMGGLLALALSAFSALSVWAQEIELTGDPLNGTRWSLMSYGPADAQQGLVANTEITLSFNGEDGAGGGGGCNSYGSDYAIDGDSISFSGVFSTMMACADDILQQELAYFEALGLATTYEMTDGQLLIRYGEDGLLTFGSAFVLEGSRWLLLGYGSELEQQAVTGETPLTLEFGVNSATGFGGCNTFRAVYSADGGTITFEPVVSTRRACIDDAGNAQESAYLNALGSATGYTLSATSLIITHGDGEQLIFERDLRLSGTSWQLSTLVEGDAASSLLADSLVTLMFDADGETVNGSGGCNSFSGRYTLDGDAIAFGPLVSTERACLDEGMMAQESAYYAALAAATRYERTLDQLTLHYGDGAQLVFAPLAVEAE
jgi:heat shock protein HslJ